MFAYKLNIDKRILVTILIFKYSNKKELSHLFNYSSHLS